SAVPHRRCPWRLGSSRTDGSRPHAATPPPDTRVRSNRNPRGNAPRYRHQRAPGVETPTARGQRGEGQEGGSDLRWRCARAPYSVRDRRRGGTPPRCAGREAVASVPAPHQNGAAVTAEGILELYGHVEAVLVHLDTSELIEPYHLDLIGRQSHAVVEQRHHTSAHDPAEGQAVPGTTPQLHSRLPQQCSQREPAAAIEIGQCVEPAEPPFLAVVEAGQAAVGAPAPRLDD